MANKKTAAPKISRREARAAAMRAIYAALINNSAAAEAKTQLLGMAPEARQRAALEDSLTAALLAAFDARRAEIEKLTADAYGSPIAAMTDIERAIIGGGAAEMFLPGALPKVIIDEAVELAKTYGADGGAALVNAVLDKIKARVEAQAQKEPQKE